MIFVWVIFYRALNHIFKNIHNFQNLTPCPTENIYKYLQNFYIILPLEVIKKLGNYAYFEIVEQSLWMNSYFVYLTLIFKFSLMRAKSVVVNWTFPSPSRGIFIRINFLYANLENYKSINQSNKTELNVTLMRKVSMFFLWKLILLYWVCP